MKPEDVPDEWAEPVAMALANEQCRVLYDTEPYTDLDMWRSVSGYEGFMKRARAALAAVIPLVEARAWQQGVEAMRAEAITGIQQLVCEIATNWQDNIDEGIADEKVHHAFRRSIDWLHGAENLIGVRTPERGKD